jgi:hypothetical protein
MLEISEPARRLIGEAWRRGHVLVLSAPWRDYEWHAALVASWRRADDDLLADHVRVGVGEWIYLRSDLLPIVRRRRLRLERHSLAGLWAGIRVRDLDPQPVPITLDDGLWPRFRRPSG